MKPGDSDLTGEPTHGVAARIRRRAKLKVADPEISHEMAQTLNYCVTSVGRPLGKDVSDF